MRLIRLEAGNSIPDELLEELRAAGKVYHAAPGDPTFGELAARGVSVRAADSDVPADADVLVIPSSVVANNGSGSSDRAMSLDELSAVVDRLLGPGGCPWDIEQTHQSLKRHLLEEVYEVFDAIDAEDPDALKEELGDLLLQPIMHAQMEARDGSFDIGEVARTITAKLVRRHPHVFGSVEAADSEAVLANWNRIKEAEKGRRAESILDGIPNATAALLRAYEVSRRAAKSGFEWPDLEAVFAKLREEENELREALTNGTPESVEAEVGDLLFTAVNVARWAGVEPEEALRRMVNRFELRFRAMEAAADKPLSELDPGEWDALWESAKARQSSA